MDYKFKKIMNIRDEAALLLVAAEVDIVGYKSIIKWADEKIASEISPEYWLIELSINKSCRIEDYISILKQVSNKQLCDTKHRLIAVVDAYFEGFIDIEKSIRAIWKIWCGPLKLYDVTDFPDSISDAIVAWDSQECISEVAPALAQKLERIFFELRSSNPNLKSFFSVVAVNEVRPESR